MGALVSVGSLSKRYGSVRALSDVSLDFFAGEVHAVVGANGAGKSTLAGILSGFVSPTSGSVTVLDVAMVHQHFTLVQEFTVAENLALAGMGTVYGLLDITGASEAASRKAGELGWDLRLDARVSDLPVGAQQRVEILKALAGDASVVVFDEPTAVLSEAEVADLLRVMLILRDEGKCVILIAHKLGEVLAVADRISVLRDGRLVGTWPRGGLTEKELAREIVGDLPEPLPRDGVFAGGLAALSVENLVVLGERGNRAVFNVSFEIARGELLGFGGVEGNGQIVLAEALAGVRPVSSGMIDANGVVAYIPSDRQHEGLALTMTIEENLLLGAYRRLELSAGPLLSAIKIRSWAEDVASRFSIKMDGLSDPAGSLSGGNQQKVVVGRCLDRVPDLVVAVNLTRGLDVGSTRMVHDQLLAARRQGAAIALFSNDPDELAALADRTYYLGGGRLYPTAQAALGGPS